MLYPRAVLGAWRAESRGSLRGIRTQLVLACTSASPRVARANIGTWELSSMEFQDKVLTCIDCGADFVFTSGEQLFFHDKQFRNEPKRCKTCKAKRGAVLGSANSGHANSGHQGFSRTEPRAVCSQCGKETTVPFRPTQGRPVLCRECFQQRRPAASA